MKKVTPLTILLCLGCFHLCHAQLLSGEAYLKGDFIEVGMNSCGAFGTSGPAPLGYGFAGNRLGFIADVDQDGFGVTGPSGHPFFGDYFIPGSHVEGWAINFNGTNYYNGDGCDGFAVPGSVTSSTGPSTFNQEAVWEGSVSGVDITRTVTFPQDASYFVITVEICNNSGATINDVYFGNNVDPDNAQSQCGSFVTTNTIVSQPTGTDCDALVTATAAPCGEPEAFLGLAARDLRAKATYGGFNNPNAAAIFNCTFAGCVNTVGSSNNADQGNSIAFDIGDLTDGSCTELKYAYVLNLAAVDEALDATTTAIMVSSDGVDISDDLISIACGMPAEIEVSGPAISSFDWTWSPAVGLNTTMGTTVMANPPVTTVYTVTGTSTNPCYLDITFDVTVIPEEVNDPPTISCPADIDVFLPEPCMQTEIIVNYLTPVGTDDCLGSITSLTMGLASGELFPLGSTLVEYTVTDLLGLTNSCSFSVNVINATVNQPPQIECPANIDVEIDACSVVAGSTVFYVPPVGTDDCLDPLTSLTMGLVSGSFFPIGSTTVEYTVTDLLGLTNSCSFTVNITTASINQPPMISCPPNVEVDNNPGICGASVDYITPIGTDDCPGPTTILSMGLASGGFFPVGNTLVEYTVTDQLGLTTSCSFNVSVIDTETMLTCPSDFVVDISSGSECPAPIVDYTVEIMNLCASSGTAPPLDQVLSNFDANFGTINAVIPDQYNFFDGVSGNNISDGGGDMYDGGNRLNTNFNTNIPYQDGLVTMSSAFGTDGAYFTRKQPGLFMMAADMNAVTEFYISGNNGADGSGIANGSVLTVSLGGRTYQGFVKRVCNAFDPSINHLIIVENNLLASQTFATDTNNDAHNVTGLAPSNRIYYLLFAGDPSVSNGPCYSDAQMTTVMSTFLTNIGEGIMPPPPAGLIQTAGIPTGSPFPLGVTMNTFEATINGSTSNCSFEVTVQDPNGFCCDTPSAICQNITVDLPASGSATIMAGQVGAGSTADCGLASETISISSFTCANLGAVPVNYMITDINGASDNCDAIVTVRDLIPPTITCPDPLLLECGSSTDPMTFTSDYTAVTDGDIYAAGEYIVTTNASLVHNGFAPCTDHTGDAAGNMLVANGASIANENVYCQKVNVATSTNYNLGVWVTSVTSLSPAQLQFSMDGTLVGSVFNVSSTNCDWQQWTVAWTSGSNTSVEICIVNQNTASGGNDFAIDDVTMVPSAGGANIVPNGDFNVSAVASDNCDPSPNVTYTDASNTITPPPVVEIITRTWTATFANGGTATCDQIITIEDTTSPSIDCPNNPTVSVDASSCMTSLVDYTGQATVDDECDSNPAVTQSPPANTSMAVNTEVTLTATDASGNSNSCTFTVEVSGNTQPALNCPPNVNVNTDLGQCGAVVSFNDPTLTCAIYSPVDGYEGPFFRDGSYYYVSTALTSWTAANAAAQSLGGQLVAIGDASENTFVSNITGNPNELLWIGLNDIASEGVYEWTNGEPVTYFNWGSGQPDNFGNEDYGGINFVGPGLWNDYPNALFPQRFVVEICASGTPTMTTSPTAGLMSGDLFPVGTTTVSYAPPACNTNITPCSFTVTVTDNEPPEALCNDVTVTLDNTGFGSTTVAAVNNSSNDACGIADISLSQSTFGCDDRLIMQFDIGGEANVLESGFSLMSEPGTPLNANGNFMPTATFGDITISAEATGPGNKGVRDRDNSALISRGQPRPDLLRDFLFSEAPDGEIKVTVSNLPAGTFALTTFHHDWFINFNFVNFEIYIDDANGTDQLVVPETNFHLSINPYNGESFNVVSDGIDDINIYIRATTDGRARLNGIIIESIDPITLTTLTVTDINGNSDQCTAAVTIEDNIAPNIISCPASTTVSCDEDIPAANPAGVVATDNCTLQDATLLSTADNQGDGCSNNAFTRTYTYEIRDDSDNPSTCEQVITVVSNTAPTLSCPPTMVVKCIDLFTPVATDAIPDVECGTATYLPVIGPTLDPGEGNNCNGATYTVTYSIEDECGRPASCTQQVAIVNNGPTIWCPNPVTVQCESDINPVIADVTVGTDCGLTSMIDISDPTILGQPGCDGTVYQVTYKVIDACDREAMCTRSYTLENAGPTITAPEDEVVECFSAIELPNVEGDDDDDDVDGPIVGYACSLTGTVEITGPVQDGDDDCFGTTYTYTYTVTDECGRSASDEQVFTIENDGPTIIAPADEEVTCESDIATNTEAASITTSCGLSATVIVLGPPVQDGPTNCPGTMYTYTYQVTDACDRTATDIQVFTIGENDDPTIEVVSDLTVDCFEAINPNPAWADVTTACGNGVDYEVTVTAPVLGDGLNCPGETYTVTYTITDACDRTATATQTYHIENEGPTMDCPDNCEVFGCFDGQAQAVIEAWINTVTATSSCSDELLVGNTYHDNGSVLNGHCIWDGITPVTFYATDNCDPERTVSCESLIIIMDDDAPEITGTPSELLVPCTANTDEALAAWLATQGGVSTYDECSSVTWSTDPVDPLALLDCESGPQAIVVEFIATDECGNSASVTGVFNTKLLPLSVNVAGLIQTEAAEAVASVEVAAYQSSGMTAMDVSDDSGDYGFEELPFEENTEIVPARTGDWLNGLSTYDLILLQQHILGLQELDSPYKRVAADANRSGTISTLDLVLLRRLILHLDEELEDNTSWRFVNADFVFPNPQDPFETEFPEAYNLSGDEEDWASFVAVKIGDLNLDAVTNSYNTGADDRSGLEDLVFEIDDQKLKAGEEYEIELHAANFEDIRGFQMTLEYDHSLISVLDINGDALPEFSAANVNLAFADQGSVPVSWNTSEEISLESAASALRVIIKANTDIHLSEVLRITSSLTRAEAYSSTDLMNVALHFSNNGISVTDKKFRLFQNQPNPFKDATTIGFVLPEESEVTLEIFDVSGRLVHSQRGDYAKGFQQIDLDRANLPNGVLYYQVSTAEASASKKMIVLE